MTRLLKTAYILAACYLTRLFVGPAAKRPSKPSRILIVQLAKLGDMVCTTPMFRAVKTAYPEAHLTVLGNGINKELLAGNPDVDAYIVWDKNHPFSIQKIIKREKFDFACITSPNFEALALLLRANIPLVVSPKIENGWSPYETRSYRLLQRLSVVKPHHMSSYAPREYLRLLEPIGISTDDTKKYVYYSPKGKESVSSFLSGAEFLVGVSPSAGNRIKEWPAERFARVADYLSKRYQAAIIVIGGKSDEEEIIKMVSALNPETKVVNTAGKLSIDELKALVSGLDLFISSDTGPIYIAEASGVPTIDIVGPVDEKEQPPIGPMHKVIVPERKKPELFVMNARVYNKEEARRQAEAVTEEEVIKVSDELISQIKHEKH